ncbi:MAG: flagellar basal body rod protein FlgB [Anaeromyxobacteraceae bacterium]
MKIFDQTLGTLERALDARLLRHNVLAGNLANSDTPGFVPREVDFAAAMRESAREPLGAPAASAGDISLALAGGDAPGLAGSPVGTVRGAGAGLDGNAVDVDRALAAVAENAIQYGASARAAQKKLAILRYAASDGNA